MAKQMIITPINGDGTVGRAILITKKSKVDEFIITIGEIMVRTLLLSCIGFALWRYVEVYW